MENAKKSITENNKEIIDAWFSEAKLQNLETLPEFLRKLSENYEHDYGTICYAVTAAAVGAAWAMDKTPNGGITGFQSSIIMWEFMRRWNNIEFPSKLIKYENMLYPQYEHAFQKTMNKDTWEWLQDKAKELIENTKTASPYVIDHWQKIANGEIPFGYEIEK